MYRKICQMSNHLKRLLIRMCRFFITFGKAFIEKDYGMQIHFDEIITKIALSNHQHITST